MKNSANETEFEPMDIEGASIIELAAHIVSAFVSKNTVQAGELPNIIASVHAALSNAAANGVAEPKEELKPAVAIKKSVTPEYIVCLEDGRKLKSMKRHLRTHYDMSPEEYRHKWGLPIDYPMTAPVYAATRSQLAKTMGLGQRRKDN
jgi:predicted transcriptional regulator